MREVAPLSETRKSLREALDNSIDRAEGPIAWNCMQSGRLLLKVVRCKDTARKEQLLADLEGLYEARKVAYSHLEGLRKQRSRL